MSLSAVTFTAQPVQAGLDQMSYNWLADANDSDETLYTMLIYLDQNAFYDWELANL